MGTGGKVTKAVAVCGVISMVGYLVGFALISADAPDSGSPGVQIADYASDHRSELLAAYLLLALGLAVLMVFAAGVYRMIRQSARARARAAGSRWPRW